MTAAELDGQPLALSVRGLRKTFGSDPVLAGLDLDLRAGSLTAVLGRSGSGKSTLLRLIAGFEHADAGTVRVGGTLVCAPDRHVPPEKRGIGVVAQEGALFPHLDVAANIGFGLPRGERQGARVQELLRLMGLSGFERRYPHQLSGGEQQRVALARALAPAPRLILLDEPFSALDPALRAEVRADVQAALEARGTTALLVTHDQEEALSIADQVGVLRGGRLVQIGDPATLYRQPVDAEVARFVGDAVLLPGDLDGGSIRCALGRLPVVNSRRTHGPATAMIRPEQLVLNADPGGPQARVLGITFHGHDATVRLACAEAGAVDLLARVAGHAVPLVGQTVTISVRGEAVAFVARPDGQDPCQGA